MCGTLLRVHTNTHIRSLPLTVTAGMLVLSREQVLPVYPLLLLLTTWTLHSGLASGPETAGKAIEGPEIRDTKTS